MMNYLYSSGVLVTFADTGMLNNELAKNSDNKMCFIILCLINNYIQI